ncbi:recombinase family protein [Paenibacillus thermoaerophilus]|nr:recombinase family protein [Paenibacillus thermoaerophilus]TMV06649.1 recombinase family protein [Paenibacillus thermoaerophilus]
MNKKTAAIYVRVSTEEQATEGFSIQAQISELERYALQNNLEIVERYIDEGFSGKTIEGRPQMRRLLKEVSQGKFQSVLIYRTDRLSRKTKDSLEIIEILQKNNIQLFSITEKVDLSNPVGIAMFQIMSSINELERNTIITRVKMGMTERAKQGKYNGGIVLGYQAVNKELIIDEDEAHIDSVPSSGVKSISTL